MTPYVMCEALARLRWSLADLEAVAVDNECRIGLLEACALVPRHGDPELVAAGIVEHLGPHDAARLATALLATAGDLDGAA